MNKKIVYVSLDVDDTQYHGAVLNQATGEPKSLKQKHAQTLVHHWLERMYTSPV